MIDQEVLRYWNKLDTKEAIVTEKGVISYGELRAEICRYRELINELAVKPNEPIGLAFENSITFVCLLLACGLAKKPAFLLSKAFKAREIDYHLDEGGVKVVLASPKLDSIFEKTAGKKEEMLSPEISCWTYDFLEKGLFQDHDFICQLTSGTNGIPKGVVRTDAAVLVEVTDTIAEMGMTEDDTVLTIPPIYHSYGLIGGTLAPLYCGARIILHDGFIAPDIIEDLISYQVTILFAVPFMYRLLNQTLKQRTNLKRFRPKWDLFKHLRYCLSAGAPISREISVEFMKYFGCKICIDYGSTETGVMCLNLQPEKYQISVGKPLQNHLIQVVDDTGGVLKTNEVGEIRYQSPTTAREYIYPGGLNEKIFRDGWYYTGDLGKINEEGYLFITGRKNNIINVAGLKVDPGEVEQVIAQVPGVKEVVVVGVSISNLEEKVKAFIVTEHPVPKEEIIYYCKNYLADYKVPKAIDFLLELPRSKTGKILRKNLKY